ncbi:MAG TPA: ABC transporter ATP-binding protein [Bryobacteraceae bacterium]|nr:ABC transporter ATP-binding protein [Bryobacteraceae bacterium]
MTPLVEVRGLRFRYEDGTAALNGVHFRLYPGETVALLGPNGSGKTTFVLHLNGLLSGEGAVEVCGLPVNPANLANIRRKIGMVFQDSDNQLFMPTVLEDVAFGLLNVGLDRASAVSRAQAALETVGMERSASRAPYHLSAGEKKRVAVAGIVAMEPEVLILDEPTANLDPPGQRSLVELIAHLPQAKILVTHDIPFALALCQRAVFFNGGVIAAEGAVEDIVARFEWGFTAERSKSPGG